MSTSLCRLCQNNPAIKNSHVTSGLVYRAIKADSPTGFFRNPNDPNRRYQDGDKLELLCKNCEQLFGDAERRFNDNIFKRFHENDSDEFEYGPWLHYFMTSIAWRTLILDLPGLASDAANPTSIVSLLSDAEETMRLYLLGEMHLAGCLRNHAVAWTVGDVASRALAAIGPNVMIRRSVFGYTVLDRRHGYSCVLHNLAGFMCFLIVKGNPRDTWRGTKINPAGGQIKPPQNVSSSFMGELLDCIVEAGGNFQISENQRKKVVAALDKNPTAAALRFRELDKRVVVDPQ